ncbi:hypothetical protein SAMN02799626_00081 [Caulobacter sp. UNC279MFTsu5.1]|nr:hypothetical protein SAMN02799626_00081 [Caulobacter sp. UNC279MFTsu5.1]
MPQTTDIREIGFRQGRRLANMDAQARMAFIAEGLPVILDSARSLLTASQALKGFSREAEILEGHALEEVAKILILVDIARCPAKLKASRIGPMMAAFYSHLARLIYADAQSWKPLSAAQLQDYVDSHRPSHDLEGDYGEYILPNQMIWRREALLYADIAGDEDTDLVWHAPGAPGFGPFAFDPLAYRVVDALEALGLFTAEGLAILEEIWGAVTFEGERCWSETGDLLQATLEALNARGLITGRAADKHVAVLADGWQMPMYMMDFRPIQRTLEEMRELRDASQPWEY